MRPMFEVAKKLFGDKPVVGAEIGISSGLNTFEVLSEWKEITKLYCIDSYPVYADFKQPVAQLSLLFCAIGIMIKEPRANLIVEDSVIASKDFEDGCLDFVYIDANHSYDFVKKDILAWMPKVKKGGIIGGHDLDWKDTENGHEQSVLKAVRDIFGDTFCHHETLFTRDSKTTGEDGYYSGDNSDWWILL